MNEHYWITSGSDQKGPYTLSQLQSMWRAGSITADTLYFQHGFNDWTPISVISDLLDSPKPPKTPETPPIQTLRPALAVERTLSPRLIVAALLVAGLAAALVMRWQYSQQPKRELAAALNSFFSEADELAAMTAVGTTRNEFATKLSKVLPRYDALDAKLDQKLVPFDDYKEISQAIFWWKATSEAWTSEYSGVREVNVPQYMSKASDIYHTAKSKLTKYAK